MNTPLSIIHILAIISFFIHTYVGDKDIRSLEPENDDNNEKDLRRAWTSSRGWCHIVSLDLLFAAIGFTLINYTDYFADKITLLQIMGTYFFACSAVFVISLLISKKFPKNFIQVFQWFLFLVMGSLTFWGVSLL